MIGEALLVGWDHESVTDGRLVKRFSSWRSFPTSLPCEP